MIYSERQYKMLEEQLRKLKKDNELKEKEVRLLKQQNKQKDEVIKDLDRYDYRGQCQSLKIENADLKKKLNKCEEQLEKLRNSLGKNSSNSCKPSSTNGFKRVVQNNRVKSDKKPGRQKGHKHSAPTVSKNPDKIIRVSKVATCTCGCKTIEKGDIARDLISVKIITHIIQYVGKKTSCPNCHKEYAPKFPKDLKNTVQYDSKVKSMLVYLNAYCNVPNQKCSDFMGFLTNRKLNISSSTVPNILKQFSKKSKPVLRDMKRQILKEPVIYEDETPIIVNGKIMSTIGIFTKDLSCLEAFENRKLESFREMGILDRYIGTVCHDHNNIHLSFSQSKDAECNFHILRYCKAEYEVHKEESIKAFMEYLIELRDKVEQYKLQGKTSFTKEEYEKAKSEYLKKLDNWDKEFLKNFNKEKSQYYDSERCLKNRLREFVDDHLRFLTDFRIDFTNNLAERGLRPIKKKLKIVGCFRNLDYAKYYCDALSIIDTAVKKGMDVGKTLESVFNGDRKIFSYNF